MLTISDHFEKNYNDAKLGFKLILNNFVTCDFGHKVNALSCFLNGDAFIFFFNLNPMHVTMHIS